MDLTWSTKQVQRQSWLHRETLSPKRGVGRRGQRDRDRQTQRQTTLLSPVDSQASSGRELCPRTVEHSAEVEKDISLSSLLDSTDTSVRSQDDGVTQSTCHSP